MLSTKLQKDLMDAYQKVHEDKRGHAAGDSDLEKQASQLASDVRYKAKGKSKPGASKEELRKLFISILGASPAPSAVKAMAKDKLLGEEVVTEMRFNDGKSGERLKALAKKRKIPMSKMKNHPQFKDDVKEGMGQEMFDKTKIGGAGRQIKKKAVELPKFKNTDNPDFKKTLGNPKKGKVTPPEVKKDMEDKDKQFGVTSEGSAYGITKGSGKPSGQMTAFGKAPRMQKGAMAYDGPNKARSEAADRVIAKTKAKRKKMKEEFVDEMSCGSPTVKDTKPKEKTMSQNLLKKIRSTNTGAGSQYEQVVHEKMDPVGQEDGDINNDGKKDGTDKYLSARRKAIGKAIAKKRGKVKEGFSAWRIDLDFNEQVKK